MDVDWSSTLLPTEDQRAQSLRRLKFRPVPVVAEPVLELVRILRRSYAKGDAYVAGFDVVEADNVAAWFLSRHRDEYGLADRLVHSAELARAMPEVTDPGLWKPAGFTRSSSLILDGTLACTLQWGGAYGDLPAMPGAEAKVLGSAFCAALFGDRYDDIDVDYSGAPWSRWFAGVAWDGTWIITDRRQRHLTVLCVTDTD